MMKPSILNPVLICFLATFFSLFVQYTYAQDGEKVGMDRLDSIRNTEPLFYYGVDFSHLRVSDPAKVLKSFEYRRQYPEAWLAFMDRETVWNNWVKHALRKDTLYYKQEEVLPVSRSMVNDFIIVANYSFPLDTVNHALKQYQLIEKTGLGLVIIPENFNKRAEEARMWIVFFDIQTREVRWATEVHGKCGGVGYTNHWGTGILNGFKNFIRKKYRVPRYPMYDNF